MTVRTDTQYLDAITTDLQRVLQDINSLASQKGFRVLGGNQGFCDVCDHDGFCYILSHEDDSSISYLCDLHFDGAME